MAGRAMLSIHDDFSVSKSTKREILFLKNCVEKKRSQHYINHLMLYEQMNLKNKVF